MFHPHSLKDRQYRILKMLTNLLSSQELIFGLSGNLVTSQCQNLNHLQY